jgi:hypothetical protein
MRRRDFITLLSGTAATWVIGPLAARAQQPAMRLIGLMGSGTAAAQSQWTTAFVQHLRELGWTEGRNVTIEYRWAEGRSERFAEIAAEFVRLKVDLILTHNTPPTLAAKQSTSTIPIVFATAGDPVESGIVTSLRRPGGNVTGLSSEPPILPARKLNSCASSSRGCASWRFSLMSATPSPQRMHVRSARQRIHSALKSQSSKSTKPQILIPRSRRLKAVRKRSMSYPYQSCSQIVFASIVWRSRRGCRRCTVCGNMSKRAA